MLLLSSIGVSVTILWMDVVGVDGGGVVAGFGGVDLGGVNDDEIVEGRDEDEDEDGCPLFLLRF